MKNAYHPGNILEYTASSPVSAGDVLIAGKFAGIAVTDIAAGNTGTVALSGVYRLEKKAGQAISQGDAVWYFEGKATNENLGQLIGVCWHESDADAATVLVRLTAGASASASIDAPYKIVRSLSDLPAPVDGRITLPNEGAAYFFMNVIDFDGLEIDLGINVFTAKSQEIGGIKNASVIISETCTARYFRFEGVNITINAPAGAYDWTGVNIYNSPDCITVLAADNLVFETFGFINSYGYKIDGTVNSIVVSPNCIWRSVTEPTAVFFELTENAVINRRIRIQDSVMQSSDALQTGIKVDPSAVVGIESFIVKTLRFSGPGVFLDGINGDSDKAQFFEAIGGNAINSTAIANMYMKNNATATPIAVIGSRYAMLGTTEFGPVRQKFVHSAVNNTLQYTSSVRRIFRVQASYTVFSGTNNIVGVYIAVNRTGGALDPTADRISESEMYTTTSGTRPESGVSQCIVELGQNDRVYMIVQNNSATTAVRIEFMNMIVEKASV